MEILKSRIAMARFLVGTQSGEIVIVNFQNTFGSTITEMLVQPSTGVPNS